MRQGYGVFGKAYEVMLRNDVHDINSIDHKFLREMILLEQNSYSFLYDIRPLCPDMRAHELYGFAQTFRGRESSVSVRNILDYTSRIALNFTLPFEEMEFGGTEKEILERGTDWCEDMARAALVLLNCVGIPARIVHLANPEKAYNGHVVVEAYYDGKFGVVDPIYGYCFYDKAPLDAFTLTTEPKYMECYPEEYSGLFRLAAISQYDPMDPLNNYSVSKVNNYTRTLLSQDHKGFWIMGEDK